LRAALAALDAFFIADPTGKAFHSRDAPF